MNVARACAPLVGCLCWTALTATAGCAAEAKAEAAKAEASGGAWSKIPLPKISLPKIPKPKVEMPSMDAVTAPFKASFRKIGDGSRKAWEGTKELFQPNDRPAEPPAAPAPGGEPPSMWQRMFGGPPPEDPGPQTIGEFMQGERPQ